MPGFAGKYYMWPEEYGLLSKYVDLSLGDYLEIGSMCGIIVASFAEKYPQRNFVCVDYFESGHGTIAGHKDIFLQNIKEHRLENVTLLEGNSVEVVPSLSREFGIAFIDANHAYDYVLADAMNCWKLVSPGGFLLFHDYGCVQETTQAVHDFLDRTGTYVVEAASSVVVVLKPGVVPLEEEFSEAEKALRNEIVGSHKEKEVLQAQIVRLHDESNELREKVVGLETKLQAIENSKGWRLLNRYRNVKNLVLRRNGP